MVGWSGGRGGRGGRGGGGEGGDDAVDISTDVTTAISSGSRPLNDHAFSPRVKRSAGSTSSRPDRDQGSKVPNCTLVDQSVGR